MTTKTISIPKKFAGLADFASPEVIRYALTGVKVDTAGGTLKLCASDGKRLIVVTERDDARAADAKDAVAKSKKPLKGTIAQNGHPSALVPFKTWKKAFASPGFNKAANRDVEIVYDGKTVELLAYDGESEVTYRTAPLEGTFPDTEAVQPKDKPVASVVMNPQLLGHVLTTMSRMMDKYKMAVRIEISPNNGPVVITAKTDEHDIKVLCMPLVRTEV